MTIKETFVDSFRNELEFYRNVEGNLYMYIKTKYHEEEVRSFIVLKRGDVRRIIEKLSELENRINEENIVQ